MHARACLERAACALWTLPCFPSCRRGIPRRRFVSTACAADEDGGRRLTKEVQMRWRRRLRMIFCVGSREEIDGLMREGGVGF